MADANTTADTSMPPTDGAAACADPNALPTTEARGCWTCDPPASNTYMGPPMPGVTCGLCRNPHATVMPRGGCGECAPEDGGAPYIYC